MNPSTSRASTHPHTSNGSRARHHVVVIGSGFGGLAAARRLRRADVDVTIVANTPHHLFQPLLYQVATGVLSEGEIAPPTREVLKRQTNARVLLGEVTGIDLGSRTVTSHVLGRVTRLPYDSLVVAAGAEQSYFGNDHFAPFAPGMKTIDDALELRGRIFGAFELAELGAARGDDVSDLLTFTVVGAGPTGVEMAGQIAELARRTLPREFRAIRTHGARVVVIDTGSHVLTPFGPELGAKAHRALQRLGVEVMLGAAVTDIDERGLTVSRPDGRSEHIAAATKIWAAGVSASPLGRTLAEQTGTDLDRAGRIGVRPDLTLPGHPEVFVVGDMASLHALPGVAQVAIQGGKYAAGTIERRLSGRPAPAPFTYTDKGSMATISRFQAVAKIGRLRLSGTVAWLLWLTVHLAYLTGFRNRLTAVLRWTTSFIGNGRSSGPRPNSRCSAAPLSRCCPAALRTSSARARQTTPAERHVAHERTNPPKEMTMRSASTRPASRLADPPPKAPSGPKHVSHHAITAVVCVALCAVVAAMSSLNVALPDIARCTHADRTQLTWIIDAYSLVFAALLLPAGALGDRFGRRRALLVGLTIFGAGSAASMSVDGATELIALRAVLGVGAALVMPATLSTITSTFPADAADARRSASGRVLPAQVRSSACWRSGLLLEFWSWRSVFALNVVLAVVAIIGTLRVVPESADPERPAPRRPRCAASRSSASIVLVYSIIEAPTHGWTDTRTLAGIGVGPGRAGRLRAVRAGAPRHRCSTRGSSVTARSPPGAVSIFVQFFAFFGFIFVILQYLQLVRGTPPWSRRCQHRARWPHA